MDQRTIVLRLMGSARLRREALDAYKAWGKKHDELIPSKRMGCDEVREEARLRARVASREREVLDLADQLVRSGSLVLDYPGAGAST